MEKHLIYVNEPIKLVSCDKIRIRGRHTASEQYLEFDWTNSGIAFNFVGNGFILSFGDYCGDAPAYIRVSIDNKDKRRYAVVNGSERVIIEGLADKRHRIEILKITEGEAKLKLDTLTLLGNGAMLRNPPHNSPRRIEFIGDSITCGYGVLGSHTDPTYLTYQQDGTRGYAGITAERFGADARFISISGKGIVCNCNGDRTDVKAGEYYEMQSRTGGVCNDGWIADAVVINIGTNDCGGPAPDDEFASAVKDLVVKVCARYPEAQIIWMYGMMSQLYRDVLRKTIREISKTDKKLHFLFVDTVFGNLEETGANGHPNVRAGIRASNLLYKKLRSVTGWKKSVDIPDED